MPATQGFVAIDMGASSARFAAGHIEGDKIVFETVEQVPHEASELRSGGSSTADIQRPPRLLWNTDLLFDLCRRAVKFASATFEEATIGIDTWGVDQGFVDAEGRLAQAAVAYRDPSHALAMARIERDQERLFALTGIQKQPFNTLCQLIARREEDPTLPERSHWLLLPDLFAHDISGSAPKPEAKLPASAWGYEMTIASTTQLMGLDGQWCEEAFDIAGWQVPSLQPEKPGRMIGRAAENVEIIRVGGHDTASAVCGLGPIDQDTAFMSVGTWSLLGCIVDEPLTTQAARKANFTNERAVDGRIGFLANIPGFYVMNRLKEELMVADPMSEWLARADRSMADRLDLFNPDLFNPESMTGAITGQIGWQPDHAEEWAGIALMSLAETTANQLRILEHVTGRNFSCIRAGGGGAASGAFCEAVADACGVPVVAGPPEATVLGNLGMQILAKGIVRDFDELGELLRRSTELKVYHPRE